ncbi:hypothetical protein W911_10885 [Hyphomicrobium nitrativorans NL23]|uniref:Uncharacterized protein n=1 Tax=Hyphomicrobium nitrativorans NL23 TaxID=1029756 RepID=V5SI36_9HYPH|nr:hypothetical protein [Hyphomicrobium nitrativorans]AHB50203.1 hypothetical protein W911_10885 [Hyphomicrobium nitrativorans NL23]
MPDMVPGPGTRAMFRFGAFAAIVVFVFLTAYFLFYGPFDEPPPSNPAEGGNPAVIDRAAPPKATDSP